MTELRTRIAKVLYERDMVDKFSWAPAWEDAEPHIKQMWLDDADAVIRELGGAFRDKVTNLILNGEHYEEVDGDE